MSSYESGGESLAGSIATFGCILALSAGAGEYVQHRQYSEGDARDYLEQTGYKNLKETDTDTFAVGLAGCDGFDAVKYEFTAKAPEGDKRIRVMVCNGLFRGATVRQGGV